MDGLKQRIIGAIVLISLAVIFVPMLFDEPHTERTSKAIDLPEEPAFPEMSDQPDDTTQKAADSSPGYRLEEQSGENAGSSPANSASTGTADSSMSPLVTSPESAPAKDSSRSQPPTRASDAGDAGADKAADTAEVAGDTDSEGASDKARAEEFDQSLKGAWLVQLGSFGNDSNAQRLRDNVRKAGYAAHTQAVKRGEKNLTRVFAGPYAVKSDATDAKKALDEAFSVNSLILSGDK